MFASKLIAAGYLFSIVIGLFSFLLIAVFETIVLKLPFFMMCIQAAFNVIFFLVCGGKVQALLLKWERYVVEEQRERLDVQQKLAKFVKILTAILLIAVSILAMGASVYAGYEYARQDTEIRIYYMLSAAIPSFLFSFMFYMNAWSSACLFLALVMSLRSEFKAVTKSMRAEKNLVKQVGSHRQVHQKVCQLTYDTDETFGPIVAVATMVDIAATLFSFYSISEYWDAEFETYWHLLLQIFLIMITHLCCLTGLCFVCGKVTENAEEPIDLLHNINESPLTSEQQFQTLGLLVTYFILLRQFRPQLPSFNATSTTQAMLCTTEQP